VLKNSHYHTRPFQSFIQTRTTPDLTRMRSINSKEQKLLRRVGVKQNRNHRAFEVALIIRAAAAAVVDVK
jgi:hypothetical protein